MKFFPFSFLFLIVVLAPCCATLDPTTNIIHPISQVFKSDYQKTWRAIMLALEEYPIEVEDNEKGYLRTENIPIETIWKFPLERKEALVSAKYSLHIKLIKGKIKSHPVVKVHILKKIFIQRGFISSPERVPSNGLEEKAILYRILREINIERAITNYHQKPSS